MNEVQGGAIGKAIGVARSIQMDKDHECVF